MPRSTATISMIPYERIRQVAITDVRAKKEYGMNFGKKKEKVTMDKMVKEEANIVEFPVEKVDIGTQAQVSEKSTPTMTQEDYNRISDMMLSKIESGALQHQSYSDDKTSNGDYFREGFMIASGMSVATILAFGVVKAAEFGIKAILSSKADSSK